MPTFTIGRWGGSRGVAPGLGKGGRRFTMLAVSYDDVIRRHARFVGVARHLGSHHDLPQKPAADPLELPSVLWSPGWVMQRLDPVRCAGVAGGEADRRVLVREVLNEWLRSKSSPVSRPPRWDFDARQAWGKLAPASAPQGVASAPMSTCCKPFSVLVTID